jgi:hypothetical protein
MLDSRERKRKKEKENERSVKLLGIRLFSVQQINENRVLSVKRRKLTTIAK